MNYSPEKNGRKPTKHETSSSPAGGSNNMWKKNKNCKIYSRYFKDDREEAQDDTDA